jgi:transcription elongation factor Elf1
MTLNQLTEKSIECPYCGETIEVLIDSAEVDQQYTEDCQVCCKPIIFLVSENFSGEIDINVFSEDDSF